MSDNVWQVVKTRPRSVFLEFKEADEAYDKIRALRNKLLDELQKECLHLALAECRNMGEHMGGARTCLSCGLMESQPVATPGNEYDWSTYGAYKVLTGKVTVEFKPLELRQIALHRV